jgi:DUF4097 and DUF4098 domain-containing protein YvlB
MKNLFLIVAFLVVSWQMACSQNIIDEKELTENGIQNLEVQGSFCQVNIQASNSNTLKFKGKITGNLSSGAYTIITSRVGNTLRVSIENNKTLKRVWNNELNGDLTFTVPANINCNVDNSSGSVWATGLNGGELEFSASSGSIKVESVQSPNIIKFNTSSGSQKIRGISGNIVTNSSSGSQNISEIKGSVSAEASSGSIKLANINGDITASTSSGAIQIEGMNGKLNLSATSGSIVGNNVKLMQNANFNTSSGSISMRFLNSLDELGFDLSASSGGLSVGDSYGNKRLVLGRGQIKIIGRSSSGSQKYNN